MKPKDKEMVMAFRNEVFTSFLPPKGESTFVPVTECRFTEFWETFRSSERWLPRLTAENSLHFRHAATYCVVRTPDREKTLIYSRGKGGDESRLNELQSVGVGGHVSSNDIDENYVTNPELFMRNVVLRELNEELMDALLQNLTLMASVPEYAGMILDDSNDVGRVHVGLVYECLVPGDVAERLVERPYSGITHARMVPTASLRDAGTFSTLESWSKVLVRKAL